MILSNINRIKKSAPESLDSGASYIKGGSN
jgi:hypothetical protein